MKVSIHLCLCVCMLMLAPPSFTQPLEPDLRQEIERLKEGQRAMQKELQEIKKVLQSQRPPARQEAPNVSGRVFHLGDNSVKGEKTAPLTLIEFTDYQ